MMYAQIAFLFMVEIGKLNTLQVVKFVDFGAYLDGKEWGEILLPKRDVPRECQPGDALTVFLFCDSEDRLIATTQKPYAQVGEVAFLKVVSVNAVGAFVDWGLPKDLLVPFSEQQHRMKVGQSYVVFVYLDESSNRLAASSKLEKFIGYQPVGFQEGDQVDLLIGDRTDIGYKVIVNHAAWGLLYNNEIFQSLETGQRVPGFIKKIRDDGKIDCCLQQPGYDAVNTTAWKILEYLHNHNGFLALTDHSSPEQIAAVLGVSKKTYKKAIGALYKQQHITLEPRGIRLRKA